MPEVNGINYDDKQVGEAIWIAFNAITYDSRDYVMKDPKTALRTIYGIAQDTRLSIEVISDYIQRHREDFIESPIQLSGRKLYQLREPSSLLRRQG